MTVSARTGLTPSHKAALAEGRIQGRVVKRYLEALSALGGPLPSSQPRRTESRATRRFGTPRSPSSQHSTQQRSAEPNLEAEFIAIARAYSQRKGLSRDAWRSVGVSEEVLDKAEITDGRRTRGGAAKARQKRAPRVASRGQSDQRMDPSLFAQLSAVLQSGDTIRTLSAGRPNEIVHLGTEGIWVQTEKSSSESGGRLVPAWMFNEAWRILQADKQISNTELIKTVKRSSAVLALLAELPTVTVVSTRPIVLRLE